MNLIEIPKLVINLPSRHDRMAHFMDEFEYINQGGDSFKIIPGVIAESPKLGIAEAHMNCIKLAKENNWENVMIMEDDVRFQAKNKTIEYVQNALHNLPEKWDILLGGAYEVHNPEPYNQHWNKIGEFCGLHCYIVNKSFYNQFLTYKPGHHIDRWLNRSGNNNVYLSDKFFAIQIDGHSDNTGKDENYQYKLKRFKLL